MQVTTHTTTQNYHNRASLPQQKPEANLDIDSFTPSYRNKARTQGIATLVGAVAGAAAVGIATSDWGGTAGTIVGGLGGALAGASVVGLTGGFLYASGASDGWDGLGRFIAGAAIGGAVGGIAGGIGGGMLGTSFGNVLGYTAGAFGGGTLGYFVGAGMNAQ